MCLWDTGSDGDVVLREEGRCQEIGTGGYRGGSVGVGQTWCGVGWVHPVPFVFLVLIFILGVQRARDEVISLLLR